MPQLRFQSTGFWRPCGTTDEGLNIAQAIIAFPQSYSRPVALLAEEALNISILWEAVGGRGAKRPPPPCASDKGSMGFATHASLRIQVNFAQSR